MKTLLPIFLFSISIFLYSSSFTIIKPDAKLEIIKTYDEGLTKAEDENKPIFLLFTGISCKHNAAIRKLIQDNKALKNTLSEDFVNVWLYVDDGTKLPQEEKVKRDGIDRILRTYGNRWAHLEWTKFEQNIQPLAVIIDKEGNELITPKTFKQLAPIFKEYLQEGLFNFEINNK